MNAQWYIDALTTWSKVLDQQAKQHADETLFIFKDRQITYRDFHRAVNRFSKGLIKLGVNKDDVVGIWMTNSIDWVICQFAIYKAGAVLLPLYSYYRESELDYALNQAGVTTLIMADQFLGKIDALGIATQVISELATASKDEFSSARFPEAALGDFVGDGKDLPSRHLFDDVSAAGGMEVRTIRCSNDTLVTPFDVMNIMYTSGTTGFPKGGMSMHVTNLVTTGQWAALAGLGEHDVILCHVPLFTNFGGLYGAALGIRNGCKVIITEQFDAGKSLRLIEEQGVTYIPGTPSMFRMLLDHEDVKSETSRAFAAVMLPARPSLRRP